MPDFNIDQVLSGFNVKSNNQPKTDFDIDKILSDFNVPKEASSIAPREKKEIINTDPKPPISGISKESSDEFNQTRQKKGLPVDSPLLTSPSAYEHHKAGKEMFSSGVEDIGTGHPYKGLGKAALGSLMIAGAPVQGILDDT